MTWTVEFDPKAISELEKLDKQAQIRIIKFIRKRIEKSDDCKNIGLPLKGNLSGLWKYRIGDYRLICRIEQKKCHVLIISIGHRKDIYKNLH